jgi:hypothetical protein
MRAALSRHPAAQSPAVGRIDAEAERQGSGVLVVRYRLTGALAELILPQPATSARADDLWRRTCFEAFVRADEDEGYCELNFSPSSQWAAYRFSGYRSDMEPADLPAAAVAAAATDHVLELSASVDLSQAVRTRAPWRLGLSAVVEAAEGGLSYWALAHPGERPDFHHPKSFTLELPEPA